jgi:hypothetical protein
MFGCGIGERIAHRAAIAAPVRGITHPHHDLVEGDHGGDLRLRQDRREVLGDEGDLGIRLGSIFGIIGSGRRVGPTLAEHALGVEGRNLCREVAGCHRQVAGDADERPHSHDVAVADAGDGGHPHHVARRSRLARRRQAVGFAQAHGAVAGAERAAQRAFDPLWHPRKGHFAVERRKNGAADQRCAAQTGQDRAAKPLHRDPAAIDDSRLRTVDRERWLVTEVDHPTLASVPAPA